MFRYAIRRLLLIIPTLIGVSILTFALSRVVPGDPARLAAGAQATPEMYEQIRQEFGLDKSIPVQYWNYVTGLLQGDWGRSILSRRPVADDLQVYWPATLELVIVSMIIATAIGVPAWHHGRGPGRPPRRPDVSPDLAARRQRARLLACDLDATLLWAPPRLAARQRPPRCPASRPGAHHRALPDR